MAKRARRNNLRDLTERENDPRFPYIIQKPTDYQTEIIRQITASPELNEETIRKINALNYTNQHYQKLESFLDHYHNRFYLIIDMVTDGVSIEIIIAYAKSLSNYTREEVNSLEYIPGTEGLITELYKCEQLLLDILDDITCSVEPPLIKQRLNFMKELLNKITQRKK